MTYKRFTGEFDKQYSGVYDDGEQLTNFEVVDLLNEQHETIQRLKQNITELLSVDIEEELLKENEQLKEKKKKKRHEDINELSVIAMKYIALEKENERLRRCINEIYTIARLEEV